jgi:hypothetical protein
VIAELLSGRTNINVLLAHIAEVLLAEAAPCLKPRSPRLWQRHLNPGLMTGEDFLAAVIAAIGNSFELIDAENLLGSGGDVRKL